MSSIYPNRVEGWHKNKEGGEVDRREDKLAHLMETLGRAKTKKSRGFGLISIEYVLRRYYVSNERSSVVRAFFCSGLSLVAFAGLF